MLVASKDTHLLARVHSLAQDHGSVGAVPECLQSHVAVHHDEAGRALYHTHQAQYKVTASLKNQDHRSHKVDRIGRTSRT